MKRYIGFDVGEHRLFGSAIAVGRSSVTIEFSPTTDVQGVLDWCVDMEPIAVAIDAPPAHSLGIVGVGARRVAEESLSIGGCYGTPPVGAPLPGWMATGMRCHRYVLDRLGVPLDLSGNGIVFEVHPTYGFRSMLGIAETPGRVRCDPERILRPKSPRGSPGHRQRVALLRVILEQIGASWTSTLDSKLLSRLDWTDAAVGAALALLRERGATRRIGNLSEGTIVIADPMTIPSDGRLKTAAIAVLSDVHTPPTLPLSTRESRRRGTKGGAEYALLRLGAKGLGVLSQEETLDALRSQLSERQIAVPVGIRSIAREWSDRALDGGFWLLVSIGGTIVIALHVVAVIGGGRTKMTPKRDVLSGNRDPWPGVKESEYWFLCDAFVDDVVEPVASILTRQDGIWSAGVPLNQTAWLGARLGSGKLERAMRDVNMVKILSE